MAQWINLNRNNRSVLARQMIFCIVRKNWRYPPTASESYGREAGREAGRQNTSGFRNFYTSQQVKLAIRTFISLLITLQFYCSIRTVFSRLLSS